MTTEDEVIVDVQILAFFDMFRARIKEELPKATFTCFVRGPDVEVSVGMDTSRWTRNVSLLDLNADRVVNEFFKELKASQQS